MVNESLDQDQKEGVYIADYTKPNTVDEKLKMLERSHLEDGVLIKNKEGIISVEPECQPGWLSSELYRLGKAHDARKVIQKSILKYPKLKQLYIEAIDDVAFKGPQKLKDWIKDLPEKE